MIQQANEKPVQNLFPESLYCLLMTNLHAAAFLGRICWVRPGMNGDLTELSKDTIVKRLVHMCNANFKFNSLALT